MKPVETITISTTQYEQLIKDQEWLQCLEAAGVDNWEGMDVAIEIKREYSEENQDDV